jgi:phosphatidylserine decarboxylase
MSRRSGNAQSDWSQWLFAAMQYGLPKYGLTALVYRLTRIRQVRFKNWLIRHFVKLYDVALDEVEGEVPDDFDSFNDFFIRELAAGERPLAADATAIACPVDGTVSQAGRLQAGTIVQAKGHDYTLESLLATDVEDADAFADGIFATLYLAPYNYHRVHAPLDATLVSLHYVPGALFSVNAATVSHIPGVFARNERLVCRFDTAAGPMILVFVGALNVGSISTPWTGEIRPRYRGLVEQLPVEQAGTAATVKLGDLLGWFNMGSTVIVVLPDGAWSKTLVPGATVRMGEAIGNLPGANP